MIEKTKKRKGVYLKIFFKILFVFFFSFIVASIYAISSFDSQKVKTLIEEKIEKNTDFELEINGDLSLGIRGLSPTIFVSDIKLKNQKSEYKEDILTVKETQMTVSVLYLLKGELNVNKVYLKDPVVNYVSEKGKNNFLTVKKESPVSEIKESSVLNGTLHFSNVYIKNLIINIKEDNNKEVYKIDSLGLSFNLGSTQTELDLNIYQKKFYKLKIKASSIKDILSQQEDLFFDINLENKDVDLLAKFEIKDIKNKSGATLELTGRIDNIKSELSLFNINFIDMPKIEIESKITGSLKDINIKKMLISIGDSKMDIKGTVKNLEKRPNLNLTINSSLTHLPKIFNYTNYDYSKDPKTIPQYVLEKRDPKVFYNTPLLIDLFNSFDAKISLDIDKLYVMTTMPIEKSKINLNLQKGVLTANPISANYANGKTSIYVKADGSSKKFVDATAYIKGRASPGLVIEYADGGNYIDPKGMVEASIFLKGKGRNLSEVVATSYGEIKVNSITELKGNGVADYAFGKDIIKSTFDDIFKGKKSKDLKIYCIAANVQINEGIAISDREIAIQTDKINAVINGVIDFKKERLDVSVVPIPVSSLGLDNSNIISMLKITGPIADPSFVFSSENAVKSFTSLAVVTTVATVASGGLLTLPVLGVGFLANNWLKAIAQDPIPCKTAYDRSYAKTTIDYKPEIDNFLKQFNTKNIVKEKGLNEKYNSSVVHKVTNEVIVKPLEKTFEIIKYPFKLIF